MKLKRKEINSQIRKDINEYWTEDKRALIKKRMRKAIFSVMGVYEELQDEKVQHWAHRMVPHNDFPEHVDRLAIKSSIRKYMRQQTVLHLGLQEHFPELFPEDKKDEKDNTHSQAKV